MKKLILSFSLAIALLMGSQVAEAALRFCSESQALGRYEFFWDWEDAGTGCCGSYTLLVFEAYNSFTFQLEFSDFVTYPFPGSFICSGYPYPPSCCCGSYGGFVSPCF
jgi:hypothetical protein